MFEKNNDVDEIYISTVSKINAVFGDGIDTIDDLKNNTVNEERSSKTKVKKRIKHRFGNVWYKFKANADTAHLNKGDVQYNLYINGLLKASGCLFDFNRIKRIEKNNGCNFYTCCRRCRRVFRSDLLRKE